MLAQFLAKQTGHMCGLTEASEVLNMKMFPLLRKNGWTDIIFSRDRTLMFAVRGNPLYVKILVDRTTNDCPFGYDRGVYFIITETGFGPDPGDPSQPLLRAGLNIVRCCLYHVWSSFAHSHWKSRMQLLEMLAWAWHLECDQVMGDGNCATYRYFQDQAAPNWAKSDLRVCMDKMIQAQRDSVGHRQQFMMEGQWAISTAYLEWTKYRLRIKRYNQEEVRRLSLPRPQQIKSEKKVCPWGSTDVMYAMVFSWGHSDVERQWRLDNLSDTASAGGPVPGVTPDFKLSVSEYALALERTDFWLGDVDNDAHSPLMLAISQVHDKKDYRSQAGRQNKDNKEYYKYGFMNRDRARWESTVFEATGFTMEQCGRWYVERNHRDWFYTNGVEQPPFPFWCIPRHNQRPWMLELKAQYPAKGNISTASAGKSSGKSSSGPYHAHTSQKGKPTGTTTPEGFPFTVDLDGSWDNWRPTSRPTSHTSGKGDDRWSSWNASSWSSSSRGWSERERW